MKNIKFGNYLYELRKESNLTQRFVAYQLGVSDKAVSKWEMGNAKPDLDKLKLLAALYNVSFNDLLNHQEELYMIIKLLYIRLKKKKKNITKQL